MKRNLIGTLSLVVLSLLFSSTGYDQILAKADVPFAFTVAKKTLPSGRYLSGSERIAQGHESQDGFPSCWQPVLSVPDLGNRGERIDTGNYETGKGTPDGQ